MLKNYNASDAFYSRQLNYTFLIAETKAKFSQLNRMRLNLITKKHEQGEAWTQQHDLDALHQSCNELVKEINKLETYLQERDGSI